MSAWHTGVFAKGSQVGCYNCFSILYTPAFKLAKFLVPVLSPLTPNEHTGHNSYALTQELGGVNDNEDLYMVSYNVESLFTNVPLQEIIGNCFNSINTGNYTIGITRNSLSLYWICLF